MSPTYVRNTHRHRRSDTSLPISTFIPAPPSPTSSDSSYDSADLPLNTPWSTPPSSASSSHPRRPVVIQSKLPPAPESKYRTSNALVIPNASRRETQYSNRTARYAESIKTDRSYHGDSRRGRTRFPKKLVVVEAVEEFGLPYSIEPDGTIAVLEALGQHDIDAIVKRSEEIRRGSHSRSGKAVSFYEKTLVHEVPTTSSSVPYSAASLLPHAHTTYLSSSPPTLEPLSPPGPAAKTLEIPIGKDPLEKIEKATAKAERATRKYEQTGRESDRAEANRAWAKVEGLERKGDTRRRVQMKVARNRKGEVVIVK